MVENITMAIETAIKNSVINMFKWLLTGIISSSYWVCLLICMLSLIFYIVGNKKAGKYATGSFISFVILQALGGVLL